MDEAFAEGLARAIAGDPGTPQDESRASYAAPFSEAEHWLDWSEPGYILRRKAAVLNQTHPQAKAHLDGVPHLITAVHLLPDHPASTPAGTVLDRTDDGFVVAVGDGAVRVVATPLDV